ncbi:hypothetical protein [Phytomonospora endophytica]|uniref:Uncharacterized protein n=1 Tax=Phytomonospora endophytica TaxID=714109 RepID=A0A841FY18_9ACTN|nr:hypothetical protein [Phytomonospora endophytica]MBB6037349.1 hypothetical protein [Phytomonospora endophytica]GIG69908.1 hypothetical protein Pen01_62030 [Phytomonospora endophytica]
MYEPGSKAALALLEAAEPGDWPRLIASRREMLIALAQQAPRLPRTLIEHALTGAEPGLLRAIADNTALQAERPDVHGRLLADGSAPVLKAVLYRDSSRYGEQPCWSHAEVREMLARPGRDDPLWSDPELVRLLTGGLHYTHHTAPVVCRAPGVAAATYRARYDILGTTDRLHALASVAEADGIDAVAALLAEHDTPEAPRPLDLASLRAALEEFQSTRSLLTHLRARDIVPGHLLRHYATIDWAAVTAEHLRKKFAKETVTALTSRPDCTAEAARALGDIAVVAAAGDHDWVIDHAVPAKNALKALRGTRIERLEQLVADVLGDDPGAWRAMRVEATRHKGTIAELFTLLTARVTAGDLPDRPRPGEVPPPPAGGRLSLKIADAAYLTLLDAATPDVRLALLPVLDGPAAHALLTQGHERIPEWTDVLLALGDVTLLTCLADDRRLSAEEVTRLMALDVPEVSHALGARHRDWAPRSAVNCPDTGLRTVILTKIHVRGEIPRLRILLDEWERHGREGLPAMIKLTVAQSGLPAFTAAIRRRVEGLLAHDDEAAALAELRARVLDGESAAGQIALLRKASAKYKTVGIEHHDWHWADLLAEHRREPFADQVFFDLTRAPACPDDLRALADGMVRHWETDAEAELADGKPLADVLAAHTLIDQQTQWIRRLLRGGHLTWTDVLTHARPAKTALAVLTDDDPEGRKLLAEHVTAELGTAADTWQLALTMLPEFTGSPLELLRTANLAVGAAPGAA